MNKRRKHFMIILTIIIIVSVILSNDIIDLNKNEISKIEIFDGSTGRNATIDNDEDISYMIDNLVNIDLKRKKISIFYMGYRYRMTFYNKVGRKVESIIINSKSTLRKDSFFYNDPSSSIDIEFIDNVFTDK